MLKKEDSLKKKVKERRARANVPPTTYPLLTTLPVIVVVLSPF